MVWQVASCFLNEVA